MRPGQWVNIRLVEKCSIFRRRWFSSVGALLRSPFRSLSTHPPLAFRVVARPALFNHHARKRQLSSVPEPLKHDDNEPRRPQDEQPEPQVPAFQMTFTCKQCETRSAHRVTKQAYFHGTVLITCPGCTNRHLISDHLRIFSDKSITIEDIMREKGELITRGRLDEHGDVEFLPAGGTQVESDGAAEVPGK